MAVSSVFYVEEHPYKLLLLTILYTTNKKRSRQKAEKHEITKKKLIRRLLIEHDLTSRTYKQKVHTYHEAFKAVIVNFL